MAGAVVGLTLIPEAIAFSIIAGVDPKVGLYASFIIAVITAFLGGKPGSILNHWETFLGVIINASFFNVAFKLYPL